MRPSVCKKLKNSRGLGREKLENATVTVCAQISFQFVNMRESVINAEKIAEKSWLYTLYRLDDGSIVLSVLCGSVAMYELSEIREHPQQYSGQSIVL